MIIVIYIFYFNSCFMYNFDLVNFDKKDYKKAYF
jgi:hypothetical protein